MTLKPTWYDPPSGWQYGFPKAWPDGLERTQENIEIQLTLDGYPDKDVSFAAWHCRFGGFDEKTTD
jgi:hypothetical protein